MPTFARIETGKWHVVGPDGCRHGQRFDAEQTPDETVTASDIVAYVPPATPADDSTPDSRPDGTAPRARDRKPNREAFGDPRQRLVFPEEIASSDADVC